MLLIATVFFGASLLALRCRDGDAQLDAASGYAVWDMDILIDCSRRWVLQMVVVQECRLHIMSTKAFFLAVVMSR